MTVTVVSTGNALPAPVIIGRDGVLPPAQNIFGGGRTSLDVTTVPTFEPFTRALDFYQGLDSTYVEGGPGRGRADQRLCLRGRPG